MVFLLLPSHGQERLLKRREVFREVGPERLLKRREVFREVGPSSGSDRGIRGGIRGGAKGDPMEKKGILPFGALQNAGHSEPGAGIQSDHYPLV